jgi:acyl-homoserine lactone acylase PvdQ
MIRRPLIALLGSMLVAGAAGPASGQLSPVQPYRTGDKSLTALNILPPGQGRYMNAAELAVAQSTGVQPPHNTDQIDMYNDLVQAAPTLTAGNLGTYFKDASFGVPPGPDEIERQYSPPTRPGVVILRDADFGVPHIYGTTREDTIFGAGYVAGEDRLFMMDVLRHVGRGRLSEFLGPSEANLRSDCAQYKVADYTDAELTAMATIIPPGADTALVQQAQEDVQSYVAGVNAFIQEALVNNSKLPGEYAALQVAPEPWTIADTVAVASLIGGSLGVGGGGEVDNALFLNALEADGHSPADARAILEDLRLADDPEAPSSTEHRFDWNVHLGPVDSDSVARPDAPPTDDDAAVPDTCAQFAASSSSSAESVGTVDGPFGPIPLLARGSASNALLVTKRLSATGRPLAVFGPQVGYWSPEILFEIDLHGPGLQARGAAFPGISMYVLLGRGDGYGYSATSASGDQVDIRAVELCEPGGDPATVESTHYLRFDGQCVPIHTRTDAWVAKPSAGGPGEEVAVNITTERVQLAGIPGTEGLRYGNWGIVQSRGEVDGQPVLFVRQRVSYGGEVDSAVTYVEIMDPAVINGPADFQRAFGRFNFTFNWFYVDGRDIAYQLGGAHPIRARGTDLDLPVWDGEPWRWQELLSFEDTPKEIARDKKYITSWNNKQAPGFRSADDNWGFASVDRVQPLDDRIDAASPGGVSLVELVKAMEDAATVDLRGDKVLPVMLDVIGDPGTERLRDAVELLNDWSTTGAHRRDLDLNDEYDDHSAVALMDEWWERALEAIFEPVLGEAFDDVPYTHDDHSGLDGNGSSWNDGWYGHVHKDLRSVLGLPVQGAFSRQYCGDGAGLAACRAGLLESLDQAVAALEDEYGPDPDDWEADEEADQIRYTAVGIQGQDPMQWQNRPTFQQVLEFTP